MTTDEQVVPRIGTYKYTYRDGKIICMMYGYVDEYAGEPAWYWRWTASDPIHVRYVLDRHPDLESEGEVVIY